MENLKLKIFDVLTETISVAEFEQWLYSSTAIINSISSNSTVYNIVNINYKAEDAQEKLLKLTFEKFNYEENKVILLLQCCKKINTATNKVLIFQNVHNIVKDLDYDRNYSLLWAFYSLREEIIMIEEGIVRVGRIVSKIQSLTTKVVSQFYSFSSITEKLKVLDI